MDALTSILTPLQAAGQGGDQLIMTGVTFGLVILIFYFLIIRPQNKKQKDTEKMLSAIKKGDKVFTIGGLHGTVQSINEEKATVTLKVDEGSSTTLEFNRSAVSGLVNPPVAKKEPVVKKEKAAKATPSDTAPAVEEKK
jgi:preprotein translocase subunit YajC